MKDILPKRKENLLIAQARTEPSNKKPQGNVTQLGEAPKSISHDGPVVVRRLQEVSHLINLFERDNELKRTNDELSKGAREQIDHQGYNSKQEQERCLIAPGKIGKNFTDQVKERSQQLLDRDETLKQQLLDKDESYMKMLSYQEESFQKQLLYRDETLKQ